MSRAIVDPDQMRAFAAQLDRTVIALREQKTSAIVGFAKLHETWRDEKYVRFEQVFSESMKSLERYIEQAEQYSHFLKQKAARAQRYLDQR